MERSRGGRPRHPDILTPAEWRVLDELREGGTNAEIAVRLGLSPDTVKYHISNMLSKLGLEDRRQLAAWRPVAGRSRLRGVLALPVALGAVARPLVWAGAGAVALAATAAVVAVLVVVNSNGDQPIVVSPPPTETPQPTPSPTATATVSPTPTTPTPTATAAPSPTAGATPRSTPTATPTPDEPVEPAPVPRPSLPQSPTFDGPPGVYTDITVGASHACALTEASEAVCWDIGTASVWDTPPGPYTFIESERDDTCAITDGGAIVCWASGGGPIPEGGIDPSSEAPSNRYQALSWIHRYTCALTEAGSAVCWPPEEAKDVWPRPPDPPPGTYLDVSVDSYSDGLGSHFITGCATTDSGDVVCWQGADTSGGDPQRVERYPGVYRTVEVSGSGFCGLLESGEVSGYCRIGDQAQEPYTALSVGPEYTCAVTAAGMVVCQGGDRWEWYNGKLSVMTPPVPASRDFTKVSVGGTGNVAQTLVCALDSAGAAVCWRDVEHKASRPEPPAGGYVAMSDGLGHTCALTDEGEADCWGWNNFGQLDVPPGRYSAISAGHRSSCALSDAGEATCWGSAAESPWPAASESTWSAPAVHRYTAIEAGFAEACALTEDGAAVCWNSGGPSSGPLADPPTGPFVSISLGWPGHACALTRGGEGACWGRDSDGQLAVPPGRYRAISAGDALYSCGIDLAGDLVCWGDVPIDTAEFPPGPYVALTTGWAHVCGLTEQGQAVCRGSLDLYRGTRYGEEELPAGRYVSVASSMFRTCALTIAGEVVCRGDEDYAEWPRLYLPGVYEYE